MIREEETSDHSAVRLVISSAFGQPQEADLVAALRHSANPQISLVFEDNGQVVGHIFFSPVTIESEEGLSTAMGLAPLAVAPSHQNCGIGGKLVSEGLVRCIALGHPLVFVLGHAHYYPRFGFVPAITKGFRSVYPVPDEVFMVAELVPGAGEGRSGLVRYMSEFADI